MKTVSYAQPYSASFDIKPTSSCSLILQSDYFQMYADYAHMFSELDTLDHACLNSKVVLVNGVIALDANGLISAFCFAYFSFLASFSA